MCRLGIRTAGRRRSDKLALIQATFPSYAKDVQTALHIRRAGSISGQQLGQHMLEVVRGAGGRFVKAEVTAVEGVSPFRLRLATGSGAKALLEARMPVY